MSGVEGYLLLKGSSLFKGTTVIYGLAGLVLLIATGFSMAENQPAIPLAQLRAEHYMNALKFALWPETLDTQSPVEILLLGEGEVCDILARVIPTQTISNRVLSLTHLDDPEATDKRRQLPSSLSKADAIYFCDSSAPVYPKVLAELKHGALTASAISSFASNGGMIEIGQNNETGSPELRINTQALKNAGILVDSQLLKIAIIVTPEDLPRAE